MPALLEPVLTRATDSADMLRRDASPRPATFNAEARTVEAVIATGTPVQRRDASGTFLEIIDVRGVDLARVSGIPVLDSHRQDGLDRVIGVVTAARLEGDAMVATIKFSDRAGAVMNDVRDGILSAVSVGYTVEEWQEEPQ